ncbi:MAG: hypothetical protein NVS4B1_20250 [Ktedonobacteraceae bacterium]
MTPVGTLQCWKDRTHRSIILERLCVPTGVMNETPTDFTKAVHVMAVKIITYEKAKQVEPFVKHIINIYREAFGLAPYFKSDAEVRAFAAILPHHLLRAGFRCVIAREDETQAILGFAYGYTGAAGQWWHDLVVQKMTREEAEYWMTDVFEVVELAVRPTMHGYGYGGKVHDMLLQGLPQRTAVLSTYQVGTNALKMYKKRGWVTLLSDFIFPGYAEPYQIMGKKLEEKR